MVTYLVAGIHAVIARGSSSIAALERLIFFFFSSPFMPLLTDALTDALCLHGQFHGHFFSHKGGWGCLAGANLANLLLDIDRSFPGQGWAGWTSWAETREHHPVSGEEMHGYLLCSDMIWWMGCALR